MGLKTAKYTTTNLGVFSYLLILLTFSLLLFNACVTSFHVLGKFKTYAQAVTISVSSIFFVHLLLIFLGFGYVSYIYPLHLVSELSIFLFFTMLAFLFYLENQRKASTNL